MWFENNCFSVFLIPYGTKAENLRPNPFQTPNIIIIRASKRTRSISHLKKFNFRKGKKRNPNDLLRSNHAWIIDIQWKLFEMRLIRLETYAKGPIQSFMSQSIHGVSWYVWWTKNTKFKCSWNFPFTFYTNKSLF